MNAQQIIDTENKHTSGVYAKQPLTIVRGQGASLFDVDGVEYLDCSSGHGVANLGHAHPKIAEALYKQSLRSLPSPRLRCCCMKHAKRQAKAVQILHDIFY